MLLSLLFSSSELQVCVALGRIMVLWRLSSLTRKFQAITFSEDLLTNFFPSFPAWLWIKPVLNVRTNTIIIIMTKEIESKEIVHWPVADQLPDFHRFTEFSQIFLDMINIISIIRKTIQVKIWRFTLIHEIIRRFARPHPRRMELANILSENRLRNPGKGTLGSKKAKYLPRLHAPRPLKSFRLRRLFTKSVSIYPALYGVTQISKPIHHIDARILAIRSP